MNTNDLYLEYARVIEMCDGTALDDMPWVCVKGRCKSIFLNHPHFDRDTSEYEFAVAVLEGKPVFAGDIVYKKGGGYKVLVNGILDNTSESVLVTLDLDYSSSICAPNQFAQCFTWTPPALKRTFKLNGVELPCPVKNRGQGGLSIDDRFFCFECAEDAALVSETLLKLLTESRDKT